MLIRHKKTFNMGIIMAVTFVGVLVLIFSPVFGGGKIGFEFSDDLFNKLSKGSSYFIEEIQQEVKPHQGANFAVSVKAADADLAVKVLMTAGAQVGKDGEKLKISGDLGKLLNAAVQDSDAMYHNKGAEVAKRYDQGADADASAKKVMKTWWGVLRAMQFELQVQKHIEQANAIDTVLKKGVEVAYNYYGVPAESVISKAGVMTALLVFYVVYTMWWGYAIFYLFDGIGLSMKKAKVKKEV
jgi:hypothetical protein